MANRLLKKLRSQLSATPRHKDSWLRQIISGTFFRMSDLRGNSDISTIQKTIETMRALATDSQISTALSYYATDATLTNTDGQIIWATSDIEDLGDIINGLFKRWEVNSYARDHILELATIGNLYMPTTDMYRDDSGRYTQVKIALNNNTIPDQDFDIIPSYKIPPEELAHLYTKGKPQGYIYRPDEKLTQYIKYPESAIIHFSLGGLLGDYSLTTYNESGEEETFDILFATPLMERAVGPTQTLSLLEDSTILSSLLKVVRFVNVDCGNAEEEEITTILQQIKDTLEQQLSINTNSGDVQSFVNPQSPNNLIYLPKVNGTDAVSITEMNMREGSEADDKLLLYYQDKKLSVVGVPKEMMNFSANEGLGGAGSVLSQRSAIYANALQRLMTAYKVGWTKALNTYFISRNMSGFVDRFKLHMSPIITTQSTIISEKRDSALSQAASIVALLRSLGVDAKDSYLTAITEILSEALPQTSADSNHWHIETESGGDSGAY